MIRASDIKLEEAEIGFWGDPDADPETRVFAILETAEQALAQEQGLDKLDPEWVELDNQVFFWIEEWRGEDFECFYRNSTCPCAEEEWREDFFIIPAVK
jgi:hypothetical protein